MSRALFLAAFGVAALCTPASAQEAPYGLRPTSLPSGAQRRAVEPDLRRLPRGVQAVPPAVDGGHFAAIVEEGVYPVASSRDVTAALADILPALGVTADVYALELVADGEERPRPDLDALYLEGEARAAAWVRETERRVGPLSDDTLDQLRADASAAYDAAATPIRQWRFQQRVGRARAEARTVLVQVDDTGIRSIVGALFDDTGTTNEVRISSADAITYAERHAAEVRGSVPDAPELVAIADGNDLRYAWRATVETEHGDYVVDVDAATGALLQVDPRFWSISEAQGRVALPGLPTGFGIYGFAVDDAASCKYTLDHAGVVTLTNAGADGFTGDVTACKSGGTVDFDVSPTNVTTNISMVGAPNYNPAFAHVNAYAWVYETLDWFLTRGSPDLPPWEVVVSHTNVCGFGIDNACGKMGKVTFGIGSATLGTGSGLVNTALDATVATHEAGHGLNNMLYYIVGQGVQSPANAEGIADYWAMSMLNTDIVGEITTNTSSDVQSGGIPRRADAGDVFPERFATTSVGSGHGPGQIIARALWNARAEMNARSPIGGAMNDTWLMAAMPGSGAGQSKAITALDVHNAFQGVLIGMLVEAGSGLPASDLLVGFAQAGLTTSPREAVIDIDEDVLDGNSSTPPTFRVWTGRDFDFTGTNTNNTQWFGDRYEIEVANDAAFTQNLVSSGVQSNVAVTGGVATATWTLPKKAWEALRDGNAVYYRVTTWNDGEGPDSVRTSTRWYQEFVEIAPGRAIVNHSGQGSACNSAPGGAAFSTALVAGLAAVLRRRRDAR